MSPDRPTDTARAVRQWEALRETYLGLGVEVCEIAPVAGLNDMVYAANGAFVLDSIAYGAKFKVPQRSAEGRLYLDRLAELGFRTVEAEFVNEGEGDLLVAGELILAGHGFRTSLDAHLEVSRIFDRRVVSLGLVDPRFYHLDTALTILPSGEVAYHPPAFDESSRAELARLFPDAVLVDAMDAEVLGLNSFCVGQTMVVSKAASRFPAQLAERGISVVQVELDELLLGGGGIKCCTLTLRT